MSGEFFVQQLVNGLTLGSLYGLIALGYSIVYGLLRLLNFAHGEVYMVGAFIGYGTLMALGGPSAPSVAAPVLIALMFLAAMIGAGVLGVCIERVAYRPLRDAPRVTTLVSALGAAFFLQSAVLLLVGARFRNYATYEYVDLDRGIHVGPLDVSIIRLFVIAATLALLLAFALFVSRTATGKAMRAIAYDREAATMMGIDVDRVVLIAFFLGSALAGAAGVMSGLVYYATYHAMGFSAGLKAFTACVVGGIGSLPGAVLGGIVIGLAEAFSAAYLSSTFQDLIVFSILVVVLIVRPTGLLRRPPSERV